MDGFVQHVGPLLEFVAEGELVFDRGKGAKHELGDIGKCVSRANGHAVLSDRSEELAEDVVDVRGGEEVAGEGCSDLGAKLLGFEKLLLLAGMKDAKRSMSGGARKAATASVGSFKRAAIGFGGFAGRALL